MAKKCATLLTLLLIATFVRIPDAAPAITTFTASTGGSANFTGDSAKFLQVTNDTDTALNMAGNFTISWYQKSSVIPSPWPRILQFGHDRAYENKFAISEEKIGDWEKIILWINGANVTSMNNPIATSTTWHHIAITRNENDFSWFIDGVFLYSANDPSANFDTTNLDLLIGSGDDAVTGGFTGNLAGVQISKSVRWETTTVFTPPIDFQNPGTGLAFSMYVSQSAVIDKSGNNLVVLPKPTDFVGFLDNFNPPNYAPTATAPDSPTSVTATDGEDASTTISWTAPVSDGGSTITEYSATTASGQTCTSYDASTSCSITTGLTNDVSYTFTVTATNAIGTSAPSSASAPITPTSPMPGPTPDPPPTDLPQSASLVMAERDKWNNEFAIYKEANTAPYDYNQILTVAMAIPVSYRDSGNNLIETKCYLDLTGDSSVIAESGFTGGEFLQIELSEFAVFTHNKFPGDCETTNEQTIPDYFPGMFGSSSVEVEFILWESGDLDITDTSTAYEVLGVELGIPPEMTSYSITRGENTETDPLRISFGDTLTVTVINETATAYAAMFFQVPEAYTVADGAPAPGSDSPQQFCRFGFAEEADGTWGRTFALPTLEDLLIECRTEYDGDWTFDLTAERYFMFLFQDESLNQSAIQTNPFILNPVTPIDWSLYPSTIETYYSDEPVPRWGLKYIVYKEGYDSDPFDFERIRHVSIGAPVTYLDSNSAPVNLMCYMQVDASDVTLSFSDWLKIDLLEFEYFAYDALEECNSNFPEYQHGMLGETQTALSVYLWTQETVSDFAEVENAFEVLHINIALPPEIMGHTITRVGSAELDTSTVHSGDIVHPSIPNSLNLYKMFWRVNLPESFGIGEDPSNYNWCYVPIEADTNGVLGESVTVPSSSQIYTRCHSDLYGLNGDWTFDESASRRIQLMTYDDADNEMDYELLLLAQTPPVEAPPTPEPTPPKKITLVEPTPTTPTSEPTPTQVSAPTAPTPQPVAPAPEPKVITPEPLVITPEPVVVEVVTPVKVTVDVVTEVLVKSELPIVEKPIEIALVAKACTRAGVWIFTKNNLLQICDAKLKPVLVIPACTGKKATPTYPWLFKAQRFKPGYSSTKSGQKLFYSVFFFKGLAIAGVDKVSSAPCSNGSVFIEKKYAKQVYTYIAKNKSLIWVKS